MDDDSTQQNQPVTAMIWTFLPGLHGTDELYLAVKDKLPKNVRAEFVNFPSKGKQDYQTLAKWLDQELDPNQPRIIIAESFSGPLAIWLANHRPDQVRGIILAATFCDTPLNPGIALLPLRPLFMVKPPRKALRHFLMGDDANDSEVDELRSVIESIPTATLTKRVRAVLQLVEHDNPPLPKNMPVLILQAKKDNLVPWEAQRKLEACYPEAEIHWIESPHLIFQRRPKQCVRHITKFAKNLPANNERS